MKSLHKAIPNPALEVWSPPDLSANSTARPQSVNSEKVLAIFQDGNGTNQGRKTTRAALHPKGANEGFVSWHPDSQNHQAKATKSTEWTFVEIADFPPLNPQRTWMSDILLEKANRQENLISENEISELLERARLQAEEIILTAQSEADELLLQAQSEIDEQKEEGLQRGRREARAEIENTINAVRKMVTEVEAWKSELISGSEQLLVEMLKDISRKMFGDGVRLDPQALHTNLNRVMENAHGLGALKIFLNPNDARLLDSSWGEQQMLILGEQVKVIASSNILPGGCLIKGNIGTVDARVDTQLDAVLKTFDEPANAEQ